MAYAKKTSKANEAFQKLKNGLAAGTAGNAYIFYGEETYLREYYLKELRKKLVPAGFEEFNYHTLEGKDLTVQTLAETAEAMPMMAERTLIVVSDFDLFKLNEEQREKLIAFLEDVPPYCCVVFLYDTVEYKPNRTMKKLYKAVTDHVEAVEFRPADNSDLVVWIARRFKALGKEIDRQTAEYLIFTCGGLMTGLVPEIAKIGAYAKGRAITQKDIDAVADPVLSAEVFRLSDAVLQGNYDGAARILGDLLKMQTLANQLGMKTPEDLAVAVETLMHAVQLPVKLSQHGITAADLPQIAAETLQEKIALLGPKPVDSKLICTLLEGILS